MLTFRLGFFSHFSLSFISSHWRSSRFSSLIHFHRSSFNSFHIFFIFVETFVHKWAAENFLFPTTAAAEEKLFFLFFLISQVFPATVLNSTLRLCLRRRKSLQLFFLSFFPSPIIFIFLSSPVRSLVVHHTVFLSLGNYASTLRCFTISYIFHQHTLSPISLGRYFA